MKIALFSDVHGNLPALEVFLASVKNRVDAYLCLGDSVNYGPWNDECLEAISGLPNLRMIEGNHERLFLGREYVDHEVPLVRSFTQASQRTFNRSDLIDRLPTTLAQGSFTAIHTIEGRSIYPDTQLEVDRNYLIGHSHHQFERALGKHRVINPGSVGQNRRFINLVSFAVFDDATEQVQFENIQYNVDLMIAEMQRLDYPAECIDYYRNKRRSL